jgi:hypothetical protein
VTAPGQRGRSGAESAPHRDQETPVDVLDFIVIGAQKASTTTLFEHLRTHPELYLPPGKEQPYFSHDEIHEAGWAQFAASTFAGAPGDVLLGKATPWYMAGCPIRVDRAPPAPSPTHGENHPRAHPRPMPRREADRDPQGSGRAVRLSLSDERARWVHGSRIV